MKRRIALSHRYGRAAHPLFPKLVVEMQRLAPSDRPGGPRAMAITSSLKVTYGGPWVVVDYVEYPDVQAARRVLRSLGALVAARYGVPENHVEYVT